MSKPPPRDLATRIADARLRLERDADAWIATAGPEGPWLVPLSPVWHDDRIWLAHDGDAPTSRNVRAEPRVRVAFGKTRDVVLIDGTAQVVVIADVPEEVVATYQERHASDPRRWADVAVVVTPHRVQAWREENELRGRTIMRDGRWLT